MKYSDYFVEGYFYLKDKKPCRKVLIIKNAGKKTSPDLLVIMMNPGASHPKETNNYLEIPEDKLEKLIPTNPDQTQYKIMKYMESNHLNYAYVINLADYCNQNSKELTKSIISDHSNFLTVESAKTFISEFLPDNTNVVIAWGCKKIFKPLIYNAKSALLELGFKKIKGYPQSNNGELNYFYHPLLRGNNWLENLKEIELKQQ